MSHEIKRHSKTYIKKMKQMTSKTFHHNVQTSGGAKNELDHHIRLRATKKVRLTPYHLPKS